MARLLAESFTVLEREQPRAYGRLCEALAGLAVGLEVDGERLAAEFSRGAARVRPATGGEPARVRTGWGTLWEVLEARQSLAEAVLADALEVVGPLETLLRLHEGLLLYVQGAARCPGFVPLLRRLREEAATRT